MAEIVSLERTADALIAQKAQQSSHHEQLAQSRARVERNLRSQAFRLKTAASDIKQKQEAIQEAQEDQSRASADSDRLSVRLNALFQVQDDATAQGRKVIEESHQATQTLKDITTRAPEYLNRLAAATERSKLQVQVTELSSQLVQEVRHILAVKKAHEYHANLKSYVDRKKEETQHLVKEKDRMQEQVMDLEKHLSSASSNLALASDKKSAVETQLEKTKSNNASLNNEIIELEKAIAAKEQALEEKKTQLASAAEAKKKQDASLEEVKHRQQSLDNLQAEKQDELHKLRLSVAARSEEVARRKEEAVRAESSAAKQVQSAAQDLNDSLLRAAQKAAKVDTVADLYIKTKGQVTVMSTTLSEAEKTLEEQLQKESLTNKRVEEHRLHVRFVQEQEAKFAADVRTLESHVTTAINQQLHQEEHDAFSRLLSQKALQGEALWVMTSSLPQEEDREWLTVLEQEHGARSSLLEYLSQKHLALQASDREALESLETQDRATVLGGEDQEFAELLSSADEEVKVISRLQEEARAKEETARRAALLERLKANHPNTQDLTAGTTTATTTGGGRRGVKSNKSAGAVKKGSGPSKRNRSDDEAEQPDDGQPQEGGIPPQRPLPQSNNRPTVRTSPQQQKRPAGLAAALAGRKIVVSKAMDNTDSEWSEFSSVLPQAILGQQKNGSGGAAAIPASTMGLYQSEGSPSSAAVAAVDPTNTTTNKNLNDDVAKKPQQKAHQKPNRAAAGSPDPADPIPSNSQRFMSDVLIGGTQAILDSQRQEPPQQQRAPARKKMTTTATAKLLAPPAPVSTSSAQKKKAMEGVIPASTTARKQQKPQSTTTGKQRVNKETVKKNPVVGQTTDSPPSPIASTVAPNAGVKPVSITGGGLTATLLNKFNNQDLKQQQATSPKLSPQNLSLQGRGYEIQSSHKTAAWLHTAVDIPAPGEAPLPATGTPLIQTPLGSNNGGGNDGGSENGMLGSLLLNQTPLSALGASASNNNNPVGSRAAGTKKQQQPKQSAAPAVPASSGRKSNNKRTTTTTPATGQGEVEDNLISAQDEEFGGLNAFLMTPLGGSEKKKNNNSTAQRKKKETTTTVAPSSPAVKNKRNNNPTTTSGSNMFSFLDQSRNLTGQAEEDEPLMTPQRRGGGLASLTTAALTTPQGQGTQSTKKLSAAGGGSSGTKPPQMTLKDLF